MFLDELEQLRSKMRRHLGWRNKMVKRENEGRRLLPLLFIPPVVVLLDEMYLVGLTRRDTGRARI